MTGNLARLDRVFNPRAVAVVGDKKAAGYHFLQALKSFPGPVYSVQVDPGEIPHIEALGFKNYLSLLDIPGPVDFAIVAVPRAIATRIVADAIRKGLAGASLFTAGFSETGTEEGMRLEKALAQMAWEAGFALIGPNCMGIYHPGAGLRFASDQPTGEGGNVAFISQSGTHLSYFSTAASLHGIRISRAVSFGNGAVLDSPDYLDYFMQDEATRAIALYIEGVKDGRRFLRSLREARRKKAVVIWRGGETEEGATAAAAHTASLASPTLLWHAAMRQLGAVEVDSLDEMLDTVKGLIYLKPARGNRLGLVAMSGGQSVVITDTFVRAGLQVPRLSSGSYQALSAIFTMPGTSYRNPFDVNPAMLSPETLRSILSILDRDDNIDCVAVELSTLFLGVRWEHDPQFMEGLMDVLTAFKENSTKPLVAIVTTAYQEAMALEARDRLVERGIPSYPGFARAARALRKIVDYHRRQAGVALEVGRE